MGAYALATDRHEGLKPLEDAGTSRNSLVAGGEPSFTASERFFLPEKELSTLVSPALAGDADAAERISLFYGSTKHGTEDSIFWLQVAAENGSAAAMERYAQHLWRSRLAYRCERAIYWIRQAIARNPLERNYYEREIAQMQRDKEKCR